MRFRHPAIIPVWAPSRSPQPKQVVDDAVMKGLLRQRDRAAQPPAAAAAGRAAAAERENIAALLATRATRPPPPPPPPQAAAATAAGGADGEDGGREAGREEEVEVWAGSWNAADRAPPGAAVLRRWLDADAGRPLPDLYIVGMQEARGAAGG